MYLCLTVLAGYGAWCLLDRFGRRGRVLVTLGLLGLGALETFHPEVGRVSLGVTPVPLGVRTVVPSPVLRALGRTLPSGAVLDVPFRLDPLSKITTMAHFIFLGAYHRQPVAACYNSFTVPLFDAIGKLANRLPDPGALAALHALGYRSVVMHEEFLSPREQRAFHATLTRPTPGPLRLVEAGRADRHRIFRLEGTQAVTSDLQALRAEASAGEVQIVAPGTTPAIAFHFRNTTAATFRTADPIEPAAVVATWRPLGAAVLVSRPMRILLPIALAPAEERVQGVRLWAPMEAGRYEVTLEAAGVVVARRWVDVAVQTTPAGDA
jgi:hypothetical protein